MWKHFLQVTLKVSRYYNEFENFFFRCYLKNRLLELKGEKLFTKIETILKVMGILFVAH